MLLCGREVVGQNRNGKTSLTDRRSVSAGEDWSGRIVRLPQGFWESMSENQATEAQINIDISFRDKPRFLGLVVSQNSTG